MSNAEKKQYIPLIRLNIISGMNTIIENVADPSQLDSQLVATLAKAADGEGLTPVLNASLHVFVILP